MNITKWLHPRKFAPLLANLSFLFSHDNLFPRWWTQMPEQFPIITGWAPAKSAQSFAGMPKGRVIDNALETLSRLLCIEKSHIQSQLVSASRIIVP